MQTTINSVHILTQKKKNVFVVDFKKLVVIRDNKFKDKIFFHEKISSQLLAWPVLIDT